MDFSFLVLAAAIWKIRVLALFFRPLCLFRIQPLEYVGALGLSCPWPGLYSPTNPIPIAPFASGLLAGILSAGKLLAPFLHYRQGSKHMYYGALSHQSKRLERLLSIPEFSVNLLLDDIPFFIFNDILKFA